MKTYRSARELQASVEQVLLRPWKPGRAPLEEVAEVLSSGRHYDWIGIYLVAGEQLSAASPQENTVPSAGSSSGSVIPIQLGQHVYGAMEVRAQAGKALASGDRILLKKVAARLAKYLHGPGAVLVRKARAAAAAEPEPPAARGYQPESERAQPRSLAAGEGRR